MVVNCKSTAIIHDGVASFYSFSVLQLYIIDFPLPPSSTAAAAPAWASASLLFKFECFAFCHCSGMEPIQVSAVVWKPFPGNVWPDLQPVLFAFTANGSGQGLIASFWIVCANGFSDFVIGCADRITSEMGFFTGIGSAFAICDVRQVIASVFLAK